MLTAALATLTLATLAALPPPPAVRAGAGPAHSATTAHRAKRQPAGPRAAAVSPSGDLYSARAKRRMASYLRMRLLELRAAGLERAAGVIEHRLSVDTLLRAP
jgi:hypothetical protein